MATNLVNNSNINNLGEKPEVFMDEVQAAIYRNKLADIRWQEEQAEKASEKLAKISGDIANAWELTELLAKIPEGYSLVVHDGEIYVGKISEERIKKMKKVSKRIARKTSVNVLMQEDAYRNIVTKSFAEPVMVKGFKTVWISVTRKVREMYPHPLLSNFLGYVEEHPEKEFSYKIVEDSRQNFRVTISVEGLKTKIVTNTFGRMIGYYLPDGKFVDTDGKNF